MFFAVSAFSDDIDTDSLLDEILGQSRERLAGRTPKAGLLFTCIDAEHQKLVDGINGAWPGIALVGCTTDGEISSAAGFSEDSVSLMLFGSDTVDMTAGAGLNLSGDAQAACRQALDEAASQTSLPPRLGITTPDGLSSAVAQVVPAFNELLGERTVLFGATAADQWMFQGTYQFCGDKVLTDSVPLLLFSGPLHYAFGVSSGWKPLGSAGKVTRAEGNVVFEIDGLQALKFYQKMLGPEALPSGECPLAILNENQEIDYLRAPPGEFADDGTGAIGFVGDVPENVMVKVAVANRDDILAGSRLSSRAASEGFGGGRKPDAAVVFSCCARKLLLGTQAGEEANILKGILDQDVPLCGFYGYGEIGPSESGGTRAKFHNETILTLLFGEENQ